MRFLREPLFVFLLLGLAIFAWFTLANPQSGEEDSGDRIVIDTQDVERMAERFRATWRRPPTQAELEALVESLVREEVMVREAKKLGLDQGDSVIRQRLKQKMEFLTTSVAQSMQPSDADLQQHLDTQAEYFVSQAQIAFDQVFLGQNPTSAEVSSAQTALDGGADPTTVGDRTLLPPSMSLSPPRVIEASFGRGFFEEIAAQPQMTWAGPVQSGYGAHLVRVTEHRAAEMPMLEEIRDSVLMDWRRVQNDALGEAQAQVLADGYDIVTPDLSTFEGLVN